MAKLQLREKYTLEVYDGDTLVESCQGTFKKLLRDEESQIEDKRKELQELANNLIERQKKVKECPQEELPLLNSEIAELENRLGDNPVDKLIKFRIRLSCDEQSKEQLLLMCEKYGYTEMMELVNESVAEGKSK